MHIASTSIIIIIIGSANNTVRITLRPTINPVFPPSFTDTVGDTVAVK